MNFDHTFIGDIEVFLTDPTGHKIQISFANNTPTETSGSWSYGVNSFLGVLSAGTWIVSVSDAFNGADSGIIYGGSIEFFGAAQSNDDVYHYTPDFMDYAAHDTTRTTLTDTNGGIDWINFASVSGDVVISLTSDSPFTVDGTQWGNFAPSVDDQFENVITGDGDDFITGNGLANELYGKRGSDRIIAGDGDDSLFGGDGVDTLNGGSGDDFIFGGDTSADLRDIVVAGAGNDTIDGGYGNDLIYGQDGDDNIIGGFGADTLNGQNGNDVITGSALSDLISGNAGDDFLNGGFGHDRINGGEGADRFYHLGIFDHGSDWIQDYNASEGDILLFGNAAASAADFQVNFAHTTTDAGERSGDDNVSEAFIIYRPTGQIIWALVDGQGQSEINLRIGPDEFDLLL